MTRPDIAVVRTAAVLLAILTLATLLSAAYAMRNLSDKNHQRRFDRRSATGRSEERIVAS